MTTQEVADVEAPAPTATTASRFTFNWRPVVYLTLGFSAAFGICAAVTWFCFGQAY